MAETGPGRLLKCLDVDVRPIVRRNIAEAGGIC